MKVIKNLAAAVAALVLALAVASCSNSSDDSAALLALASSSGSSVPTTASSAHMTAEAVAGGIKFTVKNTNGAFNDKGPRIVQGDEIDRFQLTWTDKSVDWTGVYPFVTAGQIYTFQLVVDGFTTESVTVRATGGSGAFPYADNSSVNLSIAADKITVSVFNYYAAAIFSGKTVTNKQATVEFFAGEGFVAATSTWDGTWLDNTWNPAMPSGANYTFELPNSDSKYQTLKTAFTTGGGQAGKKTFVHFFYSFDVPGLNATCRTKRLRVVPSVQGTWESN